MSIAKNSGRLFINSATVSPRWTPSFARPPATRCTRAAYSPQVVERSSSSSTVTIAGSSASRSAVAWKARARFWA